MLLLRERNNKIKPFSGFSKVHPEMNPEGGMGRDGSPLLGAILAPLAVPLHETLAVPSEAMI
jgi:hypothetical protein